MSEELASRFSLAVGSHDLELHPLDAENYAVIIDGDYEAAFAGFRTAHRMAVTRVTENNTFSVAERLVVSDLAKWSVETVDTFNPEGN